MPRKAKDEEVIKNTSAKKTTVPRKSATSRKDSSSKKVASATESNTSKNVKIKESTGILDSSISKKATSVNKPTTAIKGSVTKNSSTTKKSASTKKSTTTKKNASATKKPSAEKKSSTLKNSISTTKKASSKRTSKKIAVPVEYYDLPTVYDKTVVKILAQTPSCLFVYWEVSEKDKLKFKKQYGEGFFQDTKPYLVVINENMNYSFEIEINDYANSWYIHIHDSDCKYSVKLIRKPINHEAPIFTSSIDIISSNEIDAPNDHILFDKLGKTVFFRNVRTNIVCKKDISSFSFISNIGKIYNIYDLYKEIYQNELNEDELGIWLSSSQFSSYFK